MDVYMWRLPLLKLGCAVAAAVVGALGEAYLPTHMRPPPLQSVPLPNGAGDVYILDSTYTQPYVPNSEASCPTLLLGALVLIALACTAAVSAQNLARALASAAVFVWAVALNELLTGCIKNWCGYYRPNYFAGCGWDAVARECTKDDKGFRRSWPSGHSSSSACAATMLTFYMLDRLEGMVARSSGVDSARTVALRAAVPLPGIVALWVAASRVHDNWHHPADVVSGAALGTACSALVYRLLADREVDRPPASAGLVAQEHQEAGLVAREQQDGGARFGAEM